MASAAQIEANRRNCQRSTGPKTERGKCIARQNAVTHGMTARTIMPVLPQEDLKELEDKIQQAIAATKPRDPFEHDLVCRAVRLMGQLDRAERVATAHLAHRVRMATRSGPDTVSADELKKVHELGSKLFFQAGIGLGYPESTGDDYPAVIVRRLEESTEGCRWLLARWAELLNVLDRKDVWSEPEIIRFVGLLGKRSIEAHFDPELNSLFHAFDTLGNRLGDKFWKDERDGLPLGYQGGFEFVRYREIAPPPSDETAALSLIRSVIERHVGRLQELLAQHEQIEAAEAAERYDRAALDWSPEFERYRRHQSARHRELMQTLEVLRKMRKEEFGMENGKSGMRNAECGMGNEQEGTAADGCRTGDGACEVTSGGCGDGENGEPTPEVSQSPIVGYDSNHVIDDSTNDKIGILSHEGMDARDQPGQGDGAGQCLVESKIENPKSKISVCQGACDPQSLTSSVKTPENVQNEANLESTQSSLLLDVESYLPEPAGRKRSQSREAVASGEWRVAREQKSVVGECQGVRKGPSTFPLVPESGWPHPIPNLPLLS